ncbi:hypothetical protein VP1G_09114 [Cytospora mali]|uniref:C2H2-type domain-containing protein n=1 Tax=Cytospora mali TaxID=578113 RepID=A0A194VDJ7_CYTMA|nr:hypothetical protein VP1G_09114 [Valsa mali var. pyri (nom. inval.)]
MLFHPTTPLLARQSLLSFIQQSIKSPPGDTRILGRLLGKSALIAAEKLTDPDTTTGDFENNAMSIKETVSRDLRVAIFWDLDNKQPTKHPPFEVAQRLRKVIEDNYGPVKVLAAYGNKSTFDFVPRWAIDKAKDEFEQTLLDEKENEPVDAYRCSVCGAKCRTLVKLEKHVKTLHERERRKKINHTTSAKKGSKKHRKLEERYQEYLDKYREAAGGLVPQLNYNIDKELARAMVEVRRVGDHLEAADAALKAHASRLCYPREQSSVQGETIDYLVLVSDDTGFKGMFNKAKTAGVKTVHC